MIRTRLFVVTQVPTAVVAAGCRPSGGAPETIAGIVAGSARSAAGSVSPPRDHRSVIAGEFRKPAKPVEATAGALRFPTFTGIAKPSGLDQTYLTGASGKLLMVEPTGGGVACFDFDRDQLVDLYFNQGGDPAPGPGQLQPLDQLYRNIDNERFINVTEACGIVETGYSQGVAVGDFDNDGFDDLLITNVGPDRLYHNQGDGTFVDVTEATIGFDSLWGSSAAWADLDLDGDLDLYVCNYVDFDPQHPAECFDAKGRRSMCQPNQVEPVPDECFLNQGDGTFHPVAKERGLFGPGNKALGVAIADFDNDGWPDIYVANDATPNFLFINHHDGMFHDAAPLLGCSVAIDGRAQASMGIAVGDYDRNGWLDLYLTHFEGEWNTLYQNLGPEGFQDITGRVGLVEPTLSLVAFGTVMADFNLDGREELLVANGHLDDPGHLAVDLEMPPQCFSFDGRRWQDCSAEAGPYFSERYVGRGMATLDLDNDGDLDVAIVHQNQPAAVLRNDSVRGHWLKIRLEGRQSNRNAIGARVTVRQGTNQLQQELIGGGSYCSACERALVFGLGDSAEPCLLDIRWPGGKTQTMADVSVDRALVLLEPVDDSTRVADAMGPPQDAATAPRKAR